jgi:hypothetical protein
LARGRLERDGFLGPVEDTIEEDLFSLSCWLEEILNVDVIRNLSDFE